MNNILILSSVICICVITIWKISPSKDYADERIDDIVRDIQHIKKLLQSPPDNSIGKRLEEANENWKRGLKARNKMEKFHLIDPNDWWNYKRGISIWDLFYPNFDCPHTVERLGKIGDGGKWICGVNHLAKKLEPCIVYSYGCNGETSFENEIVARTNCSVYMFDHTIDIAKVQLPKINPDRVFIEKVGLGVKDSNNLRSLQSTMKKYGHTIIDVIKIDAEGAEFAVFDNIKNDFPDFLPFGQASIEIHFLGEMDTTNLEKYKSWLINLESMGLRAFRNEINLIFPATHTPHYPRLSEYSFINVKNPNSYLLQE